MNSNGNPILALLWTFGLMSLFAVGGANSAIPEMQRVAVDVQHWMSDKEFADLFAISQLSPGPNVLIVTLIGYSVAGIAGALVATVAMCGPTAVACLLCGPPVAALPACALAGDHPGGAGSALDRADGRQRPDPGAKLGSERACGPLDGGRGGCGVCHPAQSVLDVACWGHLWFCWPYLIKIVRSLSRVVANFGDRGE